MQISKFNFLFLGVLFVSITFFSCKKEFTNDESLNALQLESGHQTLLGNKLENPYSIENMQRALDILSEKSEYKSNIQLSPSHLYIKFKPENYAEYSILKADSNLILYDYPLDFEIIQLGEFYHDPAIPLDKPTYLYCAVKIDQKLPKVNYDILAHLFIPDEDDDFANFKKQ